MTTVQAGRPRYTKGNARRESIISAAEAMFAETGYNQPSMIDIAGRCGISRGGLLRYFPSKESLLVAVLERRGMTQPHHPTSAPGSRFNASDVDGIWAERGHRFDALLDLRVVNGTLGGALSALMRDNASDRQYLELFVTLSAEATNPHHPAHELFMNHYRLVQEKVLDHIQQIADKNPRLASQWNGTAQELSASVIGVMDGLQVQSLYNPGFDAVAAFDAFLSSVGLVTAT